MADLEEIGMIGLPSMVGKALAKFGRVILGPAAEQGGHLLSQNIGWYRLKNLVAINEKFLRLCEEKGFDPKDAKHLAWSVGLPLIEKASYQDDDFLQERWANLILSSIQRGEGSDFSLGTTHVEILNQFSRLDCEVLEYIVENGMEYSDNQEDTGDQTKPITVLPLKSEDISEAHPETLAHISLEKLVSLGCVNRVLRTPLNFRDSDGYGVLAQDIIPTLIGLNLYIAASGRFPKWAEDQNS